MKISRTRIGQLCRELYLCRHGGSGRRKKCHETGHNFFVTQDTQRWTPQKSFRNVFTFTFLAPSMRGENLLMVADSEHDANMLYAVRMFVPDPFVYLRLNGKCHIVMSDLEIDRARKQARHCKVLSLGDYQSKLKKSGIKKAGLAHVIRAILKEQGIKKVYVPANFSLGLAEELKELKVKVRVMEGAFFPQREIKRLEEVKKISAALMMAEVGLAEGIQALKRSKIGRNRELVYNH